MRRISERDRADIVRLITERRWAALATLRDDGTPLASQVAFAVESRRSRFLLHLSSLAEHTRNLARRPEASLVVGDPDLGERDPQTLARVGVSAVASALALDDPEHESAAAAYLRALPDAAPRFSFADFRLFALEVKEAHYVGGFARACRLDGTSMRAIIRGAGR